MRTTAPASSLADYGLKSSTLTTSIDEVTHRLILTVMGLEKHGKTRFCLSAPDPLAYLHTDVGDEGLLQMFKKHGKRLIVGDYHVESPSPSLKGDDMIQAIAEACRPKWEAFKSDYLQALKSPKIRSVVVDTGTGVWELRRLSKFGKLTQVPPVMYGQINSEMSLLITAARHSDKNVLWIHRMKPEWEDYTTSKGQSASRKTGQMERTGYRDIGYEVQSNLMVYRGNLNKQGWPVPQTAGEFRVKILDCRLLDGVADSNLAGEVLEGEMFCDFPHVAALAFGDDPEEWMDECYRRMHK